MSGGGWVAPSGWRPNALPCGPDDAADPVRVASSRWPTRLRSAWLNRPAGTWDGHGRLVPALPSADAARPAPGSWRHPGAAGVLAGRRAHQALVVVTPRRPASARSRTMAAAAATRAAPIAISAI